MTGPYRALAARHPPFSADRVGSLCRPGPMMKARERLLG
jgi:hypothetical protein